jgi:hypothetical protein
MANTPVRTRGKSRKETSKDREDRLLLIELEKRLALNLLGQRNYGGGDPEKLRAIAEQSTSINSRQVLWSTPAERAARGAANRGDLAKPQQFDLELDGGAK